MQNAEDVRQRTLTPVQCDLRRLEASGSARQISSHTNSPRGLQKYTAAPRLCLQLQLPATWRDLLETPKNSGESEWELVSLNFEIDADRKSTRLNSSH